jgi:uncharacterized protein (DUF1697 family)
VVSGSIEAQLSKKKGLNIKILLIEASKFSEILRRNPYTGNNFDEKSVYVSFALANTGEIGRDKILLKKTKLSNNFLETNLKVLFTTRNLNYCREIEKLAAI